VAVDLRPQPCPNLGFLTSGSEPTVADILPFKKPVIAKKPGLSAQSKGATLCRQGHHRWRIVTSQKFDVKQGRLVTVSECRRCAKRKIETL
jgi:hypothetical protein